MGAEEFINSDLGMHMDTSERNVKIRFFSEFTRGSNEQSFGLSCVRQKLLDHNHEIKLRRSSFISALFVEEIFQHKIALHVSLAYYVW